MWLWFGIALGQTPEFQDALLPADDDGFVAEVKEPVTKLTAELGFTFASGNAVFVTLNGGLSFSHRWRRNRLQAPVTLNVGQSIADVDGSGTLSRRERRAGLVENARRFIAEPRYDRFISDHDSLFVVVGFLHDPFLGYLARPHETVGYSRLLVDTERTELRAEIGFDFAQEFYVEGTEPSYMPVYAARLLGLLGHELSDSVQFNDTVEIFENVVDLRDFRLLNTASFSSALSSKLTLKVTHKLLFDNVPVEGFRRTDQTTMLTLVATLI